MYVAANKVSIGSQMNESKSGLALLYSRPLTCCNMAKSKGMMDMQDWGAHAFLSNNVISCTRKSCTLQATHVYTHIHMK